MSSYKRYIVLICFLLLIPLFSKETSNKEFNEDLYILQALDFERNDNLKESGYVYLKLFRNTLNYDYFTKSLRIFLSINDFETIIEIAPMYLIKEQKDYESILRIYSIALLNLDQSNKALEIAKELVNSYMSALNYEVLANVYFVKKDYDKAVSNFEISYLMSKNPNVLSNLTNILYAYLDKKNEALAYLETHVRIFDCDPIICSRLISIYQEQNNIDGIISTLKRSYNTNKRNDDEIMAAKSYDLLIAYLEKKDINEAIEFLEQNRIDDVKLVNLYKRINEVQKALNLTKKLYDQNGNIDFLAQIAILEFEGASNKKDVLNSVIKKFEDVLVVLDSHVYQNYLGYLLIDYEIDILRGLELVRQAIEKAPNNMAYVDSKAWGYYKLGECKLALDYMKKVVDEVGFIDEEIKLHWKKIKECSK